MYNFYFDLYIYAIYIVIQNFKYFTYGYPFTPDLPVYGLYQPILDRFMAITPYYNVAKTLVLTASSRYQLCVCQIDCADNFNYNIIDNEICDSWTLTNKSECPVGYLLSDYTYIPVASLIPKLEVADWDINQEKQWLLMSMFWIGLFEYIRTNQYDYSNSDLAFTRFLPLKQDGLKYWDSVTENKILSILYHGKDFEKTDREINELFANDSQVTPLFIDQFKDLYQWHNQK